jgi:hypothetical protein
MTDTSYFDGLYGASADPWRLRTAWYERRKRALTVAALPRQRYRRGFEPGCAIGELTAVLAERCAELLSVDLHADAVAAARRHVAAWPSVTVRQMLVPQEWPDGRFDLVVLSEIGYFATPAAWRQLCRRVATSADADATVLACHWLHPFAERTQPTEQIHAELDAALRWPHAATYRDGDFLIDVWSRQPASVAELEGLR